MTRINLKVKIHLVDNPFPEIDCRTEVWFSERAAAELAKFGNKNDVGVKFLKKVKHYAQAGFATFEGKKGYPIRHEWDGVRRIAYSSTLYRLIGFYDDDAGKNCFIVIDAFLKRTTRLSPSERKRIDEVGRVRRVGAWKKRST